MNSQIKRISLTDTRHLEIEIRKQPASLENITEDALGAHRVTIGIDTSVETLTDINAALVEMGAAPVTNEDWQRVRDIAAVARTF